MKQASYEDEFSFGVCPILEDIDLDAMTDEQLQEELSNWQQQSGGDGPLDYVVEDNIRLVERHIELRGMSKMSFNIILGASALVGVFSEYLAPTGDEVPRRFVACDEERHEEHEDLAFGQVFPVDLGTLQHGDDVVVGTRAVFHEALGEVVEEFGEVVDCLVGHAAAAGFDERI